MFCKNCGNEIEENGKFCSVCGTAVETVPQMEQAATLEEMEPVVDNSILANGRKKEVAISQKTNPFTVVIIFAVIAIFAGAIFLGIKLIGPMFDKRMDQMVYVQDEELYYLKDMSKPEKAIEIDKLRDIDWLYSSEFSQDGKYLFYYSECDDDNYYTLSRVNLTKLKANKDNDKYIEEIASDVQSYTISENDTIYYLDDKDSLVQYKNGKETVLEKDVQYFLLSEDKKTIFYYIYDDEKYEFASVNTSNGKITKIDDDILEFSSFSENGYFVYIKSNKEDTVDIYVSDGLKQTNCVAENVYSVLTFDDSTGMVYYQTMEETEKPLYDFVDDTASESDAKIAEPDYKEGLVEVSEEEAFDACMSDWMREEYLTGKKKDLKKYYENLDYNEDFQMYYDYDIDTYENYYYDDSAQQWYFYDYDKYEEAYDKFAAISDRVYLRENLKEEEYTIRNYSVYGVSINQKAKEICTGVQSASVDIKNNLVLYSKAAEDFAKIDIMDIDYTDDVIEYLDENLDTSGDTYYRIGNGQEQKLDVEGYVYCVCASEDGKVVLGQYDDELTLYYTEVKNGKMSTSEKIAKDVVGESGQWIDGAFYYINDYDADDEYGTLYKYENGKSTKIATKMSLSTFVTSDSRIITMDDDLLLYDMSGESKKIAKDVENYSYLSKDKIVYESKDDLYLYTNKEDKIRIAKDVQDYSIYIECINEDEKEYNVAGY